MLEKIAFRIRHHPLVTNQKWLWDGVRPLYLRALGLIYAKGLPRTLNGTDTVKLDARLHGFPHDYEPEVWHHLMARLQPNDVFVDVGAYYGLYAVAIAKRLRGTGGVVAFEPNAQNRDYLEIHCRLNQVTEAITIYPDAVGAQDGTVTFALQDSQSTIVPTATGVESDVETVSLVRLDTLLAGHPIQILKIDVEGYEEQVLQGATAILSDPALRPRHIYVEIHSYVWETAGTTEASLLGLLTRYGYTVTFLDGRPVENLASYYGEVVASQPAKTTL